MKELNESEDNALRVGDATVVNLENSGPNKRGNSLSSSQFLMGIITSPGSPGVLYFHRKAKIMICKMSQFLKVGSRFLKTISGSVRDLLASCSFNTCWFSLIVKGSNDVLWPYSNI